MLRLIWTFLLIAAIAAGAAWLADHPGAVAIDWLGYRLETSLAVAVLGLLFVCVVLTGALSLLRRLRGGIDLLIRRRAVRRQKQGLRALTEGMAALAAGDTRRADLLARRAGNMLHDSPALPQLLEAQAAEAAGDHDKAQDRYKAVSEDEAAALLGLRGLIAQAMRADNIAYARDLIADAERLRPKSPWVGKTKFELDCAAHDWHSAQDHVTALHKTGAYSKSELQRAQAVLSLARARDALRRGWQADALDHAGNAAKLAPDLAPAAGLAARLLGEAGKRRRAEVMLENGWAQGPHPLLATAFYALAPGEAAPDRLRRFARLAARNPDHRDTRLMGAELALAAEDVATAESYLAPLTKATPESVRACLLAAMIAGEKGESETARHWLAEAATAPREPGWHCRDCGRPATEWAPVCAHCGAFDGYEWGRQETPPAGPLLALQHKTETELDAAAAAQQHPPGNERDSGPVTPLTADIRADDPGPLSDDAPPDGNRILP